MASSGVILEWTWSFTVTTGARPQAPRQATVSRVNRESAEVFCLSSSYRYSRMAL